MICVSIGRSRHRHMIAEHEHLASQGAELVELRLDFIRGDIHIKELLAKRPGPVIATCRREQDGGRYSGSEETRQSILRMAVAQGVDYIDLEEDVASTVPRYGKTKRIVSLHDFRKTPKDLKDIHKRMSQLDADIIKIATMANAPHDNIRMLELIKTSKTPTVGICMGEMGAPSRLLAGRFGAPFTYATFHAERALAPGQISFDQMRNVYHYDNINSDTAVYAVIADPVAHSQSPLVHNAALQHLRINAVYIPIRVSPEHLQPFLDDAPQLGISGLSITIPHKEAAAKSLKQVDRSIVDIGAANTIVYSDLGMMGYNTDCPAAIESLQSHLPDRENYLASQTVLVLGAGGVAKAVAYSLIQRDANVVVTSRTEERASVLAKQLGCRTLPWKSRHGVDCSVLINCTPVGMHPSMDETPYDRHYLKPSMTVFDTVYNPENTLLIKQARRQGCATVTGTEMFVRQAALQFHLFTGQQAPEALMAETLRKAVGAVNI